jgi:hypothetical protein
MKGTFKNLHDNAPATKTGRPLLADSELPDEAEGDAGGKCASAKHNGLCQKQIKSAQQ